MKRVLRGGPVDGCTFEDDLEGVEVTNVPNLDASAQGELVRRWHRYVYDHTDNNVAVFRYDGETT